MRKGAEGPPAQALLFIGLDSVHLHPKATAWTYLGRMDFNSPLHSLFPISSFYPSPFSYPLSFFPPFTSLSSPIPLSSLFPPPPLPYPCTAPLPFLFFFFSPYPFFPHPCPSFFPSNFNDIDQIALSAPRESRSVNLQRSFPVT